MLFAAETWPFTVAMFLLLVLAFVESVAIVLGASLSQSLQRLISNAGEAVAGPVEKVLGWLSFGRAPLLVPIAMFLAGFALTGFALNLIVRYLLGFWAPTPIAVIVALFVTLPTIRLLGARVAASLPAEA